MMTTVDRLIRAWEASDELHSFRAGATGRDIQEFEREAGWTLPTEWRAFYMYANGARLFQDNLAVAPLLADEQLRLSLASRILTRPQGSFGSRAGVLTASPGQCK
jgi:cell wall assembly regulator SMI1